jgi:adenylylsulfate kinase
MIVWLTGNSGTGKTTIAQGFRRAHPDWIILDGDEMRASISVGAGFTKAEREEHNLRVARLARTLSDQGHHVLVSVIAPFAETRKKIDATIFCVWVHLYRSGEDYPDGYPYEDPEKAALHLDTAELDEDESVRALEELIYGKINYAI